MNRVDLARLGGRNHRSRVAEGNDSREGEVEALTWRNHEAPIIAIIVSLIADKRKLASRARSRS